MERFNIALLGQMNIEVPLPAFFTALLREVPHSTPNNNHLSQ